MCCFDKPTAEEYQKTIDRLRSCILDMEYDQACLPEDYSVTEYVEHLSGICKELAGVRDAADRVMNTRFDSPAKGEQHEYLSNLHDEEDALVELLDNLSPEARDYK